MTTCSLVKLATTSWLPSASSSPLPSPPSPPLPRSLPLLVALSNQEAAWSILVASSKGTMAAGSVISQSHSLFLRACQTYRLLAAGRLSP